MSFEQVIRAGDRKETLKATRDLLASLLAVAEPKEAAPLARQLLAVVKELADLGEGRKESFVDEFRAEGNADS